MCKFIQTTEELNQLCLRLAEHKFVTVDTEFIREKTYWPQLCLIQIASVDEAACVDPLAPGINMQALFDLMQNKNVVKVFMPPGRILKFLSPERQNAFSRF